MITQSADIVALPNPKQHTKPEETALDCANMTQFNSGYVIKLAKKHWVAKLAFSCLVKPQAGDQVLVCQDQHRQYVILAIIQRYGHQHMHIDCPEQLRITSQQTIELQANAKIHCHSQQLLCQQHSMVVDSQQLTSNIQQACLKVTRLELFSEKVTQMAKHCLQHFTTYCRKTEKTEHLHAANVQQTIKGMYSLQSGYSMITSKQQIKIDAQHIHMG